MKESKYFSLGLTVQELKELLEDIPSKNIYGDPYEIWMRTGDNISSPVKSIDILNKDTYGCDILFGV